LKNLFTTISDRTSEHLWMRINTAAVLLVLTVIIFAGNINQPLFLWLQGVGRQVPSAAWASLTLIGDALTTFALLLLFARKYPRMVWSAVLAGVVVTLAVHGLKHTLAWPRPPAVLPAEVLMLIGPEYRLDSFPSGHSAAIWTFVGVWLMSNYSGRKFIPLILLATSVSLSRVMVGAHWPVDITSGALIGWLGAWCGVVLAKRWQWGVTLTGQRIIVAILLAAAAMLVGFDAGYTQAKTMVNIIAVTCLLVGGYQMYGLLRYPQRVLRQSAGDEARVKDSP
jgi:membrane-associated phospholipid phosphatase